MAQEYPPVLIVRAAVDLTWDYKSTSDSLVYSINIYRTKDVVYKYVDSVRNFTDTIIDNSKHLLFNIKINGNKVSINEFDATCSRTKFIKLKNNAVLKCNVWPYRANDSLKFVVSDNLSESGNLFFALGENRKIHLPKNYKPVPACAITNEVGLMIGFEKIDDRNYKYSCISITEQKGDNMVRSILLMKNKIIGGYNF